MYARLTAALYGGACGSGGMRGDCLALPCPFPIAINLTLQTAGTGSPVSKTTITVDGIENSTGCTQYCAVSTMPGKHHMKISAPGFQSFETDFTVTGTVPDCGCPQLDTQSMTVTLTPV
jgi:hypothetical protein